MYWLKLRKVRTQPEKHPKGIGSGRFGKPLNVKMAMTVTVRYTVYVYGVLRLINFLAILSLLSGIGVSFIRCHSRQFWFQPRRNHVNPYYQRLTPSTLVAISCSPFSFCVEWLQVACLPSVLLTQFYHCSPNGVSGVIQWMPASSSALQVFLEVFRDDIFPLLFTFKHQLLAIVILNTPRCI